MPEEAITQPTTTSSEPNPAVSDAGTGAGSGAEGAGEGSAVADSFASERDALETRARSFQSEADRQKARADRLEAQLAGNTGGELNSGDEGDALTARALYSMLDHREAMSETVTTVRERFPNAHPEIFRRFREYDSPEALYLAAEESHTAESTYREQIRREEAERVQREFAERGAGSGQAPPANTTTPVQGDPTPGQLAAMSVEEFNAVPAEVIERVLRGATT